MASVVAYGDKWRAHTYIRGERKSKVFRSKEQAEVWASCQERMGNGPKFVKDLLKDHRIASCLPLRQIEALNSINYDLGDILSSAMRIGKQTGVYFLIQDIEIVYIGQTVCLSKRLYAHTKNRVKFDSFAFIPCKKEHLDQLEEMYITAFLPRYNTYIGKRTGIVRLESSSDEAENDDGLE